MLYNEKSHESDIYPVEISRVFHQKVPYRDDPARCWRCETSNDWYTLWLFVTVRHGFSMALIEIDGLANLIAWWIFPWRTVK